jgi:hypothetical protein
MSCIWIDFEKQIVIRTKRLIRVRSVRCVRSIFRVFRLPGLCMSGSRWRSYPPMIRRKTREPEGLQQRFELQKDFVFATPKNIRQDSTRVMIDRMPQPAGIAFVADKRPHLVHLGVLPRTLDGHRHIVWVAGAQERGVHRLQRGFFPPESRHTVFILIRSTRAVSRTPLALRLLSMIWCFTSGSRPRYR